MTRRILRDGARGVALALLAVAVTAGSPAPASAAQRYASAGGTGSACTAAQPCALTTAFNNAGDNDEVIVAPGDYPLTASLINAHTGITLHGMADQPRPHLTAATVAMPISLRAGQTLRHIRLTYSPANSWGGIYANGAGITIEDVVAVLDTPQGGALVSLDRAPGAVVRNSVIKITTVSNTEPLRVENSTGVEIRNVTVISAAPWAIMVYANVAPASATIRNTIARHVDGTSANITINAPAGQTSSADLDYNSYAAAVRTGAGTTAVTEGTHNLAVAPLLAEDPFTGEATSLRSRRRSTPASAMPMSAPPTWMATPASSAPRPTSGPTSCSRRRPWLWRR